MSYGMTYEQYWDGDNDLPKYYREKHKIETSRRNFESWLMGFYVYEAVSCCAPILNALAKDKKPLPYRDAPLPLTKADAEKEKERKRREQMRKAMDEFRIMTAEMNKKCEKKGEDASG